MAVTTKSQSLKYCIRCVLPNTRPGITFDSSGVCSGCLGHQQKKSDIDWQKRGELFQEIVQRVKTLGKRYDCIIPVSGGKDSTWQVVKCLELGLKPLAVTWRTPGRTELGQRNLENLIRQGVDHIDYSINPEVERKFMYQTLVKTGSTAVPMHMALFAIPLRLAVDMDIPLVVWGESPHMEYGGSEDDRARNTLDRNWLTRHGILQGTSAADWVDKDLTARDLAAYFMPTEEEFRARKIQSVFLGFYFNWDPEESLRVAQAHGFRVREEGPKVGYYNYADIDCDFISVHHHFKWLKFGFTRLFDNLAIEIRNGRMSREQALRIIKEKGDQRPSEDIKKLCEFLRISEAHFREIEEKFRNPNVWKKIGGVWKIENFIIPDWRW